LSSALPRFVAIAGVLALLLVAAPTTARATGLLPLGAVEHEPAVLEAEALVLRLSRRSHMVRAHRAFASIATLSLFVAQGFGIFNHIALSSGGLTREEALPTLMTHRLMATTAVSTYFVSGLLAWTMPGPDGRPAGARRFADLRGGRRVHASLSIAHAIAMVATIALGAVSSFATRDTPAWTGTVIAHHVAAATTGGLLVVAIGARSQGSGGGSAGR
jgi:hypothetical protein